MMGREGAVILDIRSGSKYMQNNHFPTRIPARRKSQNVGRVIVYVSRFGLLSQTYYSKTTSFRIGRNILKRVFDALFCFN